MNPWTEENQSYVFIYQINIILAVESTHFICALLESCVWRISACYLSHVIFFNTKNNLDSNPNFQKKKNQIKTFHPFWKPLYGSHVGKNVECFHITNQIMQNSHICTHKSSGNVFN